MKRAFVAGVDVGHTQVLIEYANGAVVAPGSSSPWALFKTMSRT
jgi:hypothetical protein